MDRSGHPPCSLLPESSWESFDARTSGSSCPCHGTTGRIASQAGTGHDDPSATGGASTDRVVGGGRSFQRTDCRKIGSYTTDGAQVASTVVDASCVSWKARSRTRRYRVGSARSWPTHPGAVVRPTSAQSRSSKLSSSPAKIPRPRSDRSATGHPERWPASLCAEGLSRAFPPDLWIVF